MKPPPSDTRGQSPVSHGSVCRKPGANGVAALWETVASDPVENIGATSLLGRADEVQFLQSSCEMRPCLCAARLASVCLTNESTGLEGHRFWNHLPVEVRVLAVKIARDEAARSFLQILNRLQALTPDINHTSRRASFRALKKVFPEQYWPDHFFVQAITSDRYKFRSAGRLLKLYPNHIGDIAAVLLTASDLEKSPSALKSAFVALARQQLNDGRVVNWGAIFLANVMRSFLEPQLAFRALSIACEPRCDKHIRFEGLRLMADLLQAGPVGDLPALRCLVTALRIYPDHVRSGELLRKIAELLFRLPKIALAHDTENYSTKTFDALFLDSQIDVSEEAQAWLQLPQFMTERERAPFYRSDNDGPPTTELLLASAPAQIAQLPRSAEVGEGDDPWLVANTPRIVTGVRRSVLKVHMRQIYYKNMSNSSVYIDKLGKTVKSVSSGHSSFFNRSQIESELAVVLAGDFVDLTLSYGHANYSHFLLDRIPRLVFCKFHQPPVKLMIDSDTLSWTKQILELISVTADLQPISMNTLYYIESVSAFSRAQHPAALGETRYLAFLRSLSTGLQARTRRRFVIHRDVGKRGVTNQEQFYRTLTGEGFEIIRLEGMTIRDQIILFKEAECIVGVHGAGFSNLVFCQPRTTVIEIIPLEYSTTAYAIIATKSSLQYYPYIEPGKRNRDLAVNYQFSDTEINIARWTKFLHQCLKQISA